MDKLNRQYQAIVDQLCATSEQAALDYTLFGKVFFRVGADGSVEYLPADTVLARKPEDQGPPR